MANETAPEQAQAAPAAQTPAPASTSEVSAILDQITTATMEGASQERLDELTSRLLPTPAPAQPAPAAVETKNEPETPAEVQETPIESPVEESVVETPETPEVPAGEKPPVQPVEEDVAAHKDYRPRLGKLPEIQREAIALVKDLQDRGQEIDLAEAESRVKAKYGIVATIPVPAPQAPTMDAMETELAAVRSQIDQVAADGSLVDKPLRDLQRREIDLLTDIKAQKLVGDFQQREQAQTQQTAAAQRQQALAQAVDRYPALKDQNSDHFLMASAIAARAARAQPGTQEYEDSRAVDAPLRFADKAAKRIGVKPAPSSTPPAAVPVKPNPVSPAPGSRTAAPPPPAKTQAETIAESEASVMAALEGRTALSAPPNRGTIFIRGR